MAVRLVVQRRYVEENQRRQGFRPRPGPAVALHELAKNLLAPNQTLAAVKIKSRPLLIDLYFELALTDYFMVDDEPVQQFRQIIVEVTVAQLAAKVLPPIQQFEGLPRPYDILEMIVPMKKHRHAIAHGVPVHLSQ